MTNNNSLETALDFANFQEVFSTQRKLLKQKFDNDCIVAYNGGLFKITQEWLGGFDTSRRWALDINGTPIEILDPPLFFSTAKAALETALNEYGQAYSLLRQKRSVRSLTGL